MAGDNGALAGDNGALAGDNGALACWPGFPMKTTPCGFAQGRDGREGRVKGSVSFGRRTSELGLATAALFQSDPVPVKAIKTLCNPHPSHEFISQCDEMIC